MSTFTTHAKSSTSRTLWSVMKCECRHLHLKCRLTLKRINNRYTIPQSQPHPSRVETNYGSHLCMEHPNPKHGKVGLQVLACLQIQQWLHNQQKRRCNKIELHKYINHGVNWRMKYILPWTQVHVLDIYIYISMNSNTPTPRDALSSWTSMKSISIEGSDTIIAQLHTSNYSISTPVTEAIIV